MLLVCGDLFDRGSEAKQLLDFLLSIPKNRLILIRGNHEDLFLDCLNELSNKDNISFHHIANKTLDTISQLTDLSIYDLLTKQYKYSNIEKRLNNYFKLTKRCLDYYELSKYIFVHGWLPAKTVGDFHIADADAWKAARWINGMKAAVEDHYILKDKIILCGHWNSSYGNYHYHHFGNGEYDSDSFFGPFVDEGIIALDACTAISGQINMVTIEV